VRVGTIDFLTIKNDKGAFNLTFNAPKPVFGVTHDGGEILILGTNKNMVKTLSKLGLNNADRIDIGTLLAIAYNTVRDGKRESYIHSFLPASRPHLIYQNHEFLVSGGRYVFIDSGINDR